MSIPKFIIFLTATKGLSDVRSYSGNGRKAISQQQKRYSPPPISIPFLPAFDLKSDAKWTSLVKPSSHQPPLPMARCHNHHPRSARQGTVACSCAECRALRQASSPPAASAASSSHNHSAGPLTMPARRSAVLRCGSCPSFSRAYFASASKRTQISERFSGKLMGRGEHHEVGLLAAHERVLQFISLQLLVVGHAAQRFEQ